VFVLATDTEPGSASHDWKVRGLAEGADVLVYDAQYTPEQLPEKKGWGHSSWLEGTRSARESRIHRLLLYHRDPDHDDAFVDGLLAKARREFPAWTRPAKACRLTYKWASGKLLQSRHKTSLISRAASWPFTWIGSKPLAGRLPGNC